MTVAAIPGVTTIEDAIGNLSQITIDLKAHPEAIPVLKNLGLLPKTQFDIDFENGIKPEDFRKNMMEFIDQLWQKK